MAKCIVLLIVGAALFITGMNIMSSGLKKVCGKSLKRLFNKIQNSRFAGLGIGAGVTALIQSSGATSVMAVGFINAGVMTVFQGICIVLGAYIGTCITGVLVSLSSFDFGLYLMLTAAVGVILQFFRKEKLKNIGEILTGLGILFIGLEVMKGSFGTGLFPAGKELVDVFKTLFTNVSNPILLLLIGAGFTALVQSSSATTGIVIVMFSSGSLPLDAGCYLVLGATIGTVIVTIIASLRGSADGKRVAVICLLVRILTALLALAIMWPVEVCCNHAITNGLLTMFGGNIQFTIAFFLIFYNLIFVGVLLPFIDPLAKLSTVLVKDKELEAKKKAIKYIDDRLLITPSIALGQTKNEITNMLDLAKTNLKLAFNMVNTLDFEKEEELNEREENIDYINSAITEYLIEISHNATMKQERKIGSYFHIINDIERIGDHAINFYEIAKKMKDDDLHFSTTAKKGLKEIFDTIEEMFDVANNVFFKHKVNELRKLHDLEEATDKLKKTLSDGHYERVTENLCTVELSPHFTTVVSDLERVADHLVNIGYAYINPTGDDENVKI